MRYLLVANDGGRQRSRSLRGRSVCPSREVWLPLPDGGSATHDGYFFVADRGGAFKGNHMDVFVSKTRSNPFPQLVRSSKERTFDAFVVSDSAIVARLRRAYSIDAP